MATADATPTTVPAVTSAVEPVKARRSLSPSDAPPELPAPRSESVASVPAVSDAGDAAFATADDWVQQSSTHGPIRAHHGAPGASPWYAPTHGPTAALRRPSSTTGSAAEEEVAMLRDVAEAAQRSAAAARDAQRTLAVRWHPPPLPHESLSRACGQLLYVCV